MEKKAAKKQLKPKGLPFGVGDAVLIRCVTHYQLGRVRGITPEFITLIDACWVADSGRFGGALKTGQLNEVEKCPSWCAVSRGAVVDVFPWDHELPSATK